MTDFEIRENVVFVRHFIVDAGRHVNGTLAVDPPDACTNPVRVSASATVPNGTWPPSGVRIRMYSRSPRDSRSSRG